MSRLAQAAMRARDAAEAEARQLRYTPAMRLHAEITIYRRIVADIATEKRQDHGV